MSESNKTAIITGGTKGIGRATIEKFASEGFNIVTCARSKRDLQQLKTQIEEQFEVQCLVFQANLNQKEAVSDFATFVLANTDSIDVLVNNVGVFVPDHITDDDEGLLEKMMELNVYSVFYLTKKLAKLLKTSQSHVFNLCSVASLLAYPNAASYTISKFALLGFNHSLRLEMKPHGVKVTAILPGAVQTPSWGDVVLPPDQIMPASDVAASIWGAFNLSKSAVVEELIIKPQLD
jgi:short-subunit dehydrogenase